MVTVIKHGIVLQKRGSDFEADGVLNPAVIADSGWIHMYYRAVAPGNRSTIGYCRLHAPLEIEQRLEHPMIVPEFSYENQGVEDPRIVCIDSAFYLSYTGYDGINALGCLAISNDREHFHKLGIIVPQVSANKFRTLLNSVYNDRYLPRDGNRIIWDKNVVFFPRRINGKLCYLHRIRPAIQLVMIESIDQLTDKFWEDYLSDFKSHIVIEPKHNHELLYIGAGCPPIECDAGWIVIYHGVRHTDNGPVYCACAALLDLADPKHEIARLPYPLFEPTETWELFGYVNNVCFPTGAVLIDDNIFIYYGAADERIACASVSFSGLIKELLAHQ